MDDLEALDLAYARFNSLRSLRVADPELTVESVGGLTVLRDPSRADEDTYNRVLGLGAATLADLGRALARFETPPQVDLPIDRGTEEVLAALRSAGLAPTRSIVWLHAAPTEMRRSFPPRVDVRRFLPEDAGRLLDLIGSGGDPIEDEVRDRRQRYYCTDRFPGFVATVDGVPAGWATLFIDGPRGVLGNAFTLPEHRRRGVQRALFAARAEHAAREGLRWVVTDVAPETSSYRNALRAGLARLTVTVCFRGEG